MQPADGQRLTVGKAHVGHGLRRLRAPLLRVLAPLLDLLALFVEAGRDLDVAGLALGREQQGLFVLVYDDLAARGLPQTMRAARVVVVVVREDDVLQPLDAQVAERLCALLERLVVAEAAVDDRGLTAIADQEDVRRVGLWEPGERDVQARDVWCDLVSQVSPLSCA
jgi:hypothetical protein